MQRTGLAAVFLAAILAVQAVDVGSASAQCPMGAPLCNQVGADGKGILAGGILGAEIGFMIPAIFVGAGVREFDEAWAFIVFPVAFAAGGAVAGYFALEDPTTMDAAGMVTQRGFPEVAVALLAVSIALIVPTFVGVLALTAYNPGATDDGGQGASGDEDAADEDAADDGGGDSNDAVRDESSDETAAAMRRVLAGGPGLLRFDHGQPLLGVPMVYSSPTFTPEEQRRAGLNGNAQDLHVPVVSGVF
ncbi:MAG: hypothetical protein AB7S26_10675 [Sandaracinaceae bacterium]